MCDAGVVTDCSFAFYASKDGKDGSALVLDGVNPAYAAGAFTYHDIISETYWPVNLQTVETAGSKHTGFKQGVVDSGTSLLVG